MDLLSNGVKLAKGKNSGRVVFRQITAESNKAEFVGIISHSFHRSRGKKT